MFSPSVAYLTRSVLHTGKSTLGGVKNIEKHVKREGGGPPLFLLICTKHKT